MFVKPGHCDFQEQSWKAAQGLAQTFSVYIDFTYPLLSSCIPNQEFMQLILILYSLGHKWGSKKKKKYTVHAFWEYNYIIRTCITTMSFQKGSHSNKSVFPTYKDTNWWSASDIKAEINKGWNFLSETDIQLPKHNMNANYRF